jgi:hypothetical protein
LHIRINAPIGDVSRIDQALGEISLFELTEALTAVTALIAANQHDP